jgi:Flp pilus assembly protein TadD
MDTNLHNIYLFKALDAYPFELETAIESLNYALSYEPKNAKALCLLAKIYAEQLGDNEKAKTLYAEALANHLEMGSIYPEYLRILHANEDYEEAQKLLKFAFTIKACDKAALYSMEGQIHEALQSYKKALKSFKNAKTYAFNSECIAFINAEIERVKEKMPKKKKTKKKVKKKKKK